LFDFPPKKEEKKGVNGFWTKGADERGKGEKKFAAIIDRKGGKGREQKLLPGEEVEWEKKGKNTPYPMEGGCQPPPPFS